ncbi:MAG: winged helix DNA-binding domain-containing protein [Nocardioidaceae bacterium]|nr:winged helix DNA-binding domain-containing protein [Nocardioidaceae bacterium]
MTTALRVGNADRRARLARRHHLAADARAEDVGTAAHALVGLHSTDPASVYLSAWARVDGITHADIDRALYDDRTVVKHMAMRRTVWAVATDLLMVVQAAASDDIATAQRRGLAREIVKAGISRDGERWVSQAETATVEALAEAGPTSGRDLSRRVPALQAKLTYGSGDKAQTVGVATRMMTILSASGQATRARAGGAWNDRQPRWVLMRDWSQALDADRRPSATEARGTLARHWLGAFGPATHDDLKWWTGWTVTQTKAALRDIGAVEVTLADDRQGLLLAADLEPEDPVAPWVALLPALDPTTMGWKGRDWYLGAHRALLFDRYGNAGPTVWSDGRVIGGWAQHRDARVVVRLLEDVGSDVAAQVDTEASRLTQWLGGVRVLPSFPTPLQRELAG